MGVNIVAVVAAHPIPPLALAEFRRLAQDAMSERYCAPLAPARVEGMPHAFDLVSEDKTLVGLVVPTARRGPRALTTLERAELSEAVLMLTLAPAQERVLVVGHDHARLAPWLAVYGRLARDITIWRLHATGRVERIDA